jgi:hypothetical protein
MVWWMQECSVSILANSIFCLFQGNPKCWRTEHLASLVVFLFLSVSRFEWCGKADYIFVICRRAVHH